MTRPTLAFTLLLAFGPGLTGCRSTGPGFVASDPVEAPAPAEVRATAFEEAAPGPADGGRPAEPAALTPLSQPQMLPPVESVVADPVVVPVGVTLDDVVQSVVEYFPVIQQATAGRRIASGQALEASGAFDHKLDAFYESQPLDFYENHRGSIGLKRDTTWGGQTFAGYRIGRGVYEPWYLERETNKAGEFKAGFVAPLVRDRAIDANRSELWQAQVERLRVETTITAAVILATRDGSAAYWEWVAAGQRLRIAEDVLRLAEDRRGFLDKQIAAGEKKAIDRVDNRRIVVSRQAKETDARRKLRQAAAKLSLYLRGADGRPRVLNVDPPPDTFSLPPAEAPALFPGDIELAQSNRPEPRELRLVSRQLGIALRQACNETLPDVDAGLLVGQDIGEPTSSKRDKSEFELEAKITLSVPLQRRKAYGKVRQLRGKIAQVRAKQQLTLDKIAIDVQVARAALVAASQRVAQTSEGLDLAEQMNVAERRLYEAGQSELFNLNLRERQAAEAASERVDALLDYHLALADYAAAIGLETNSFFAMAETRESPKVAGDDAP